MKSLLGGFEAQTYALLRIVAGILFACHGVQKLFGALGGSEQPLVSLRGLAGLIELVGGALIAVGLYGSIAAFISSGEMAAAYFLSHAPRGFWPIVNRGELAALYCFLFLFMAARGSGIWSVDAARRRARR
jgi:putative oxidoreductase